MHDEGQLVGCGVQLRDDDVLVVFVLLCQCLPAAAPTPTRIPPVDVSADLDLATEHCMAEGGDRGCSKRLPSLR